MMPKPGFRELRAKAKERQERDYSEREHRRSLLQGELGAEVFLIRLKEAALARNVHGSNGLMELKWQAEELYRSDLQAMKRERHPDLKEIIRYYLKRHRSFLDSIDKLIKEIEPKKKK